MSGRMQLEKCDKTVSCSTLYRWVNRFNWRPHLPRKGKPYRKRNKSGAGMRLIPERVDIDERPLIVDENKELGHWEGETVHGQDGYFLTLVELVSKLLLNVRVPTKNKVIVSKGIKRMLKPYKAMCKTITLDNGGEFVDHKSIARALKCKATLPSLITPGNGV
ncbi:IS30 family transposase [Microbulbifer epialgicus]|uniref:IS30 family transposase n=1 Tax=Microbulbifer epialgicus TaxID=393907 RepID=A0ABV4P207_9GAMM